jgi:hypothetical protein
VEDDARFIDVLDRSSIAPALRSGRAVDRLALVGRDDGLIRVVQRAGKQFQAVDPSHDRYWLLWISLEGDFGKDVAKDRAVGSLYGVMQAVVASSTGATTLDCFFAWPGIFERCPDLDGALICDDIGVMLCLNELSERAAAFRRTRVARGWLKSAPPCRRANGRRLVRFWWLTGRLTEETWRSSRLSCDGGIA